MPRISLFGLGVESKSPYVTAKIMQNLYAEQRPSGEKSSLVAYATPGLTLFADFGDTPVRGGIEFEGLSVDYVVHRGTLWEVNNAGVKTNRGSLLTTSGRVSMAHNGVQVMIVDGTYGYIFNTQTNVFAQITDPDFPANPTTVCFLSGYFIISLTNSSRFYVSAQYDGLTWDALDFANAETSPDPIVSVYASNGQLILLGPQTMEFWGNSGAADFPFVALQGTATEWGLAARWSIAKYDNTFACVVKNRMGQVMVAQIAGYLPKKISTPDIDSIINQYSSVEDASAYSYMIGGHPMFVLSFPSAGKSWLYDGSTGFWSPLKSFGLTRHRSELSMTLLSSTIVADYSTGRLYRLSPTALTDNGDPIEREIVGETISMPDNTQFSIDCLRLDMETGIGVSGNSSDYYVSDYMNLPGTVGSFGSTPDSAAFTFGSAIEIVLRVALTDYTPAAFSWLVAQDTTGAVGSAWRFSINSAGILIFEVSNGAAYVAISATAATGVTDGTETYFKANYTFNDGIGNRVGNFYKSADGVTWTPIGATVTTPGTVVMNNSATAVTIGAHAGGGGNAQGKFYYCEIRNGISGSPVAVFNPAVDARPGNTSWTSSATGEVWTLQGSATLSNTLVPATVGADPQVSLSISRDNGNTWGPQLFKSAGKRGDYAHRVEWRRLGSARFFTPRIKITDPVPTVFVSACVNPEN